MMKWFVLGVLVSLLFGCQNRPSTPPTPKVPLPAPLAKALAVPMAPISLVASATNPAPYVLMGWTLSTDPKVVGYRLYWGGQTQVYTNHVDAGLTNQAAISPLVSGATYYIAATDYYTNAESPYSAEVIYTVTNSVKKKTVLVISNTLELSTNMLVWSNAYSFPTISFTNPPDPTFFRLHAYGSYTNTP